jgi:hypothetical protein
MSHKLDTMLTTTHVVCRSCSLFCLYNCAVTLKGHPALEQSLYKLVEADMVMRFVTMMFAVVWTEESILVGLFNLTVAWIVADILSAMRYSGLPTQCQSVYVFTVFLY